MNSKKTQVSNLFITADVTDESQVKSMIDEVVSKLGDLTIACNNVGTGQCYSEVCRT